MRLLGKQILNSLLKYKINLAILLLLMIFTSFMYFFVQFSIDKNLVNLEQIQQSGSQLTSNQQQYLTALQSNTILAMNFLMSLIGISAFIFFMFYRRYFTLHKKDIGCYKALGFSDLRISLLFIGITFAIAVIGSLIGLLSGYFGADILLNANKESYAVTGLEKGVNGISFFYGVILVIVILCLVTALSCYPFYKKDAALLISGADTRRENKIIANFANFCANLTPKRYRLSVRIAMRKPVTILLTVAAVGTVSTLFILSGSLNMSSQKVYSSQTDGHHYQYETQYDTYQEGANTANGDGEVYYLHEPIAIALDNNQENIQQQIIGMDSPSAC